MTETDGQPNLDDYHDGDIVLVSLEPLLYGRIERTPTSVSLIVDPKLSQPEEAD
jgi:hypothetical protein